MSASSSSSSFCCCCCVLGVCEEYNILNIEFIIIEVLMHTFLLLFFSFFF